MASNEVVIPEFGADPLPPTEYGTLIQISSGLLRNISDGRAKTMAREQLELRAKLAGMEKERDHPETENFFKGVPLEAAHQRTRWSSDHDAGKSPADWFWLVGYLAGKCLSAHISGDREKALHHTISSAAALANWHMAIKGATNMRPGIDTPPEAKLASALQDDWVDVKDRLPEVTNGMFLVAYLFQDKHVCQKVCAWMNGYFRDIDLIAVKSVTHWRPLPPSPASAQKDGE